MRCLQEMPDFLESTNFDNPHELLNNPSHRAFKTKLPRFEYINEHQPQLAEYFGRWMTAQHNPDQNCFDVIDISKYAKDCAADQPLFVDVGGGVGNQSASFKEKLPDAPGRVILQDHATVLENAVQTEGVESMEFDFWEEQPIKSKSLKVFHNAMSQEIREKNRLKLNQQMLGYTISASSSTTIRTPDVFNSSRTQYRP